MKKKHLIPMIYKELIFLLALYFFILNKKPDEFSSGFYLINKIISEDQGHLL